MFVDSGLTVTPLVDLVDIVCFLNEVVADFLPLPSFFLVHRSGAAVGICSFSCALCHFGG